MLDDPERLSPHKDWMTAGMLNIVTLMGKVRMLFAGRMVLFDSKSVSEISEGFTFERGTRHKGFFGAVMFNPIAPQMKAVRSLWSPYFSSEPWLGIKKGRDPGCEVRDWSRHSASKSQDSEATRCRGVPIIVPLKDRLQVTVGPSVRLVEVWKAKWHCRVGR